MTKALKNIEQRELDDAIVVALGSSLAGEFSSRQVLLEAALNAFPTCGLAVRKVSRWWSSAAWPDPSHPGYLNGVAQIETALAPSEVMSALLAIEGRFGRRRDVTNGPRTLDLDLVAYGRTCLEQPGLVLPHPRAADRRFVMGPLAEIAPNWRHPISGKTAAVHAGEAAVGRDAAPLEVPAA